MSEILSRELQIVLNTIQNKSKLNQIKDVQLFSLVFQELALIQKELQQTQELNQISLQNVIRECQKIDNITFHIVFTSFLIKIINVNKLTQMASQHIIIEYLLSYQERSSDELAIKSFQCFIPLVQGNQLNFKNLPFVENIIQYILYNKNSSKQFVCQTCITLQTQLLDSLAQDIKIFRLEQQDKQSYWINALSKFILDSVSILNEERPTWFPQKIPLDKELALSILLLCIENMNKDILANQDIQSAFKYNLPNAFKKSLEGSEKKQLALTFRCVQLLLIDDPIQFDSFIEILKKYIDNPQNSIQKTFSLQTLIILTKSGVILRTFQQQSNKNNQFYLILNSLVEIVQNLSVVQDEFNNYKNFNEQTDQPNQSSPALVIRLISYLNKIILGLFMQQISVSFVQKIDLEFIWRPCHRILKHITKIDLDDQVSILVFDAIQTFIFNSNKVDSKEIQEYFITLMCNSSVNNQNALNTILVVTSSLGCQLTCDQWAQIFESFIEAQLNLQEVKIVFQDFNKLLGQCYEYDNDHLQLVLEGIFKYIQNSKDNPSNLQNKVESSLDKTYNRLNVIWKIIKTKLLDFINSKSDTLMIQANNTLCEVIVLAFGFYQAFLKLDKQQEMNDEWSLEEYQDTLLKPWTEVFQINSFRIKDSIFQYLSKILSNASQINTVGWRQILIILNLGYKDASVIVQVVNTLKQLTLQLDGLNEEQFQEYLLILDQIQKRYRNFSYDEQICQIFWTIWVYYYKKEQTRDQILDQLLYYARIEYPETRKTAMNVMINIIINFNKQGPKWLSYVTIYFFKVLDFIVENVKINDEWEVDAINSINQINHILDECDKQCQDTSLLPQITIYIFQIIQVNRLSFVTLFANNLLQLYSKHQAFYNQNSTFIQILDVFGKFFQKPITNNLLLIEHIQHLLPVVLKLLQNILTNQDLLNENILQHTISLLAKIVLIPSCSQIKLILQTYKIVYVARSQNILILLSDLQENSDMIKDSLYDCWSQILDITTSDTQAQVFFKDQLSYLHLTLKKITQQSFLFKFLQKLQQTIKRLRSDGKYLHSQVGKSVWLQCAEILVDLAQDLEDTHGSILLLQDTLPLKIHYNLIFSTPDLEQTNTYEENLQLQKMLIEFMTKQYLKEKQDNKESFTNFMNHYDSLFTILQKDQDQMIVMSPIESLVQFCISNDYKSLIALPLLLKISQIIIKQYIKNNFQQSKLISFLLKKLITLQIPAGLFKDVNNSVEKNSALQSGRGHLCFLMPLLSECVITQEESIRILLSQCFDLVFEGMQFEI